MIVRVALDDTEDNKLLALSIMRGIPKDDLATLLLKAVLDYGYINGKQGNVPLYKVPEFHVALYKLGD